MNEIKCKVSDVDYAGNAYDKVGMIYECKRCGKNHSMYYRKFSELTNKGIDICLAAFRKIHFGYYTPYLNEMRKNKGGEKNDNNR